MPIRDPERPTSFTLVDVESVRSNSGLFIGLGAVLMVFGLLAVLLPFIASLATTIAVGWVMMLAGVGEGYHALRNRRWAGSAWELVSAAVQVVAGGLVAAFPVAGKLALTLILAVYFACEGILKIIRAVQHRRLLAPGWLVFDGLLSLALGVLILVRWPSAAVWAIGLLVGINLLFGGMSMLLIGAVGRPVARA
jgi:uncharacterized membrane protein HdeD (DUF308 family)